MSYERASAPLTFFRGYSDAYIFLSSGLGDSYFVEDYGYKYDDVLTMLDTIGNIMFSETKDEMYVVKIMEILARKYKVISQLRGHRITGEEWQKEMGDKH